MLRHAIVSTLALGWVLAGCPGDDAATTVGSTGTASSDGTTARVTASSGPMLSSSTDAVGTTVVDDTTGSTPPTTGTAGSTTDGEGASSSGGSSSTGPLADPCDGPEVVLFAQSAVMDPTNGAPAGVDRGGGNRIRAADDFSVPLADQCWCITRAVFVGTYLDTFLSGNIEVSIHDDGFGVPLDPPVWIEVEAPVEPTPGTFSHNFVTPVVVSAGFHWLGVLPTLPSIEDGIWFWSPSADPDHGSPWAMQSNFLPFVPTCSSWAPGLACHPSGPTDVAFELHGVIGGDACP